jgi:hypothetical protein
MHLWLCETLTFVLRYVALSLLLLLLLSSFSNHTGSSQRDMLLDLGAMQLLLQTINENGDLPVSPFALVVVVCSCMCSSLRTIMYASALQAITSFLYDIVIIEIAPMASLLYIS